MEMTILKYAYIGDAAFELFIREYLVKNKNIKINNLHKECTKIVCAHSQSIIIQALEDEGFIDEDEINIYKKGRNTKTNSKSKNSNIQEYHRATGFETLIGYLYLNDIGRFDAVLNETLNILEKQKII